MRRVSILTWQVDGKEVVRVKNSPRAPPEPNIMSLSPAPCIMSLPESKLFVGTQFVIKGGYNDSIKNGYRRVLSEEDININETRMIEFRCS